MTLTEAMQNAVNSAKLAYHFHPGSYSYDTLLAILAIERELEHVIGPLGRPLGPARCESASDYNGEEQERDAEILIL